MRAFAALVCLVLGAVGAPLAPAQPATPQTAQQSASDERLLSTVAQYRRAGRFKEARDLAERGLAAAEREVGPNHVRTANWLVALGLTLRDEGRLADAEARLKRALAIFEKQRGVDAAETGDAAAHLASVYFRLGRMKDADTFATRALAISVKRNGEFHEATATAASLLATIYAELGRFDEAVALAKRALDITRKVHGENHADTATSYGNLAELYRKLGRYGEAEPLSLKAIEIDERITGRDSLEVAADVNNLAYLYENMERFDDAERAYRRVLAIRERKLGDHPDTAATLSNFAALFVSLDRPTEAEPLAKRALAIHEKVLGPHHPQTALSLQNLAAIYALQRRLTEATPLFQRALAIFEKALGPDAERTLTTVNNLAAIYRDEGRLAEAEAMYERVLAGYAKNLPPEHPQRAATSVNLGGVYLLADRGVDAERVFRAALSALTKALPPDHPHIGAARYWVARALLKQDRFAECLAEARRAADIIGGVKARANARQLLGGSIGESLYDPVFELVARAAFAVALSDASAEPSLRNDAYLALQRAATDPTTQALANMAARFATRNDALADLLREQQALIKQVQGLDRRLAQSVGSISPAVRAQVGALRTSSESIGRRLRDIDAKLRRNHPAYVELADPQPVSLAETQKFLKSDEAVLIVYPLFEATMTIAVSSFGTDWHVSGTKRAALASTVTALRRQLDPDLWEGSFAPFDRAAAYALHRNLVAPLDHIVNDKAQLFVVANGPLSSLPLSVLVTEEPKKGTAGDADPNALRDTPWLIKRHALTNLPAVSSLRALRLFANKGVASEPFAGFGDPVFAGAPDRAGARRSIASIHRGTEPSLTELRALTRLPETANELKALARALGASEMTDVYLGNRATESQVKSLDLSRKRVVAFATHGFMAGDLGAGEPGLALSPPPSASERDNGYLSASEVAALNLRADWVILSACNTAAGDQPGAKGFSGLTRAFFQAGARSLLVSHWPVWDDTAPRLTAGTVKAFQGDPDLGRAGALRKAMLDLMADKTDPRFAHPAAWAPFVLAGETRAD